MSPGVLAERAPERPRRRPRAFGAPVAVNTTRINHNEWGPLIKVMPGGYYVGFGEEKLMTVLGSCVAACIRDREAGVGGMNHFMLPMQEQLDAEKWSNAARYGNYAMELLINEIIKRGGQKNRLEIKLFGGGDLLSTLSPVGVRNIRFVKQYLQIEGLVIEAEDLGAQCARKVVYNVRTGRAKVKHLDPEQRRLIDERDRLHRQHLVSESPGYGSIELF